MLLFFLVFFGLQIFVLFCCAAAGNDAASQELSDQEQLQFIREFDTLKSKKVLQSLEIGLFFCQIFIFII